MRVCVPAPVYAIYGIYLIRHTLYGHSGSPAWPVTAELLCIQLYIKYRCLRLRCDSRDTRPMHACMHAALLNGWIVSVAEAIAVRMVSKG